MFFFRSLDPTLNFSHHIIMQPLTSNASRFHLIEQTPSFEKIPQLKNFHASNGQQLHAKGKKKGSTQKFKTHLGKTSRFPFAFDACPSFTTRRRFKSAEAVDLSAGASFTIGYGHQQFLVATVASTTAVTWVDCWRIRSIEVWCINHIENPTTVTIIPVSTDLDSNSFNDRDSSFTCSSISEAQPGYMKIIPAEDSPLGGWHKTSNVNSTGSLFIYTPTYGGASSGDWSTQTVDIVFEFVPHLIGSVGAYSSSITSGSVGTIGARAVLSSNTGLIPVGVNNLG